MTDIKKFEVQYERLQMYLIAGISIGTLGLVGDELGAFLEVSEPVSIAFSGIILGGWFFAVYALFRLRNMRRDMDKKGDLLTGVIDDERVQAIRSKAYTFGFMAALVWQICIIVGAPVLVKLTGFAISAVLAANVTIALGIVASTGRFLYLDRV